MTNVARLTLKVCGPEREVLSALKINGVTSVLPMGRQDADSTTYLVECEPGLDMRKPIFSALAAAHLPIIGFEAQGLSLEDVFLTAVEEEKPAQTKKRKKGGKSE